MGQWRAECRLVRPEWLAESPSSEGREDCAWLSDFKDPVDVEALLGDPLILQGDEA